jgi:hypothetical protein
MMEAASTSETSVNFDQTTRRNNPEDKNFITMLITTRNPYLSLSSINYLVSCRPKWNRAENIKFLQLTLLNNGTTISFRSYEAEKLYPEEGSSSPFITH